MHVFERGWLSANGILFRGRAGTAFVDTGYSTHASQTVALVRAGLGACSLHLIVNTHLHSDHCGGNAALQRAFPLAQTMIPPGLARFVRDWDEVALSYAPTGQQCPRFRFEGLLVAGRDIALGDANWQIHSAPGHDPHSVVLFEPATRTLISADALWESGFGIVFEELEGIEAFNEVAQTLDLIESLAPALVIPGHGAMFSNVSVALAAARSRLEGFARSPEKHAKHATKVLLKFKLLELQEIPVLEFQRWALATEYFSLVHQRFPSGSTLAEWIDRLIAELVHSGAARHEGNWIRNG